MYINHSVSYLLSSLIDSILGYTVYVFIIISSIIFLILLLTRSNVIKYIVLVINIIICILILINYNYHLFSINIFKHFIYNIYFYFLNSIAFIIVNTTMLFKDKYYKMNSIVYVVSLIFLLFSLFMTYYLSNNHFLILFNIYSEILLGNIIYIFYYIYLILLFLKNNSLILLT